MRIPLLLVLLFATFSLYAQRVENIRAEAVNGGERVTITYDINGAADGQKFNVTIYSSHNNFSTALTRVTGDLNNVTGGTGKRIEWNAKEELVDYNGDITFELRADPIIVPLAIKTPSSAKRGKNLKITYSGVAPGENVKIDLLRNGVVVNQVGNTTNPSIYTWSVPTDVEKGSDYSLRITAGNRTASSGSFPVKNKIKVWMIAVPAVVVVGVVVLLSSGKSKDKEKDLPTPPDPND